MEQRLGSFEAKQPRTWTGDVQLQVFVTSERAVAVRTGGQFAGQGGEQLAVHFGLLGVLVYRLFFAGRAARRRAAQLQQLEAGSLDELLARHRQNWALPLHEVKRARLERVRWSGHGPAVARLVLERQRGEALELLLQTPAQLQACRRLLGEALPGVLAVDPKLAA